jgi:hypothetical protein
VGSTDTVAPVPIPIVAIAHRERIFELFAEGLPFSPPITSSSAAESLSTNLAFENVVLRAYAWHDRLSFGSGETIYNQQSTFQPGDFVNASRVVGGRYELAAFPLRNRGFRLSVDLDPALHGIVSSTFPRDPYVHLRPAPERGSQTEFNLSYRKRNARTFFEYGARYINYVAHFVQTGTLADRNTGFRPYASFGIFAGRP